MWGGFWLKYNLLGEKLDFSFIKLLSLSWDLYFLELNFVVLAQMGTVHRRLSVTETEASFLAHRGAAPRR